MIIVRNVFVATPGNASKLAAQLKNAAGRQLRDPGIPR